MTLSWVQVIWTVSRLHLKQIAVNGFVIISVIVQPLIIAVLTMYLLRDAEGFQAVYVIVGSAAGGLWTGTLFSIYDIRAERWAGTLEPIIGSPTPLATVILGKTLANMVMSVSSMLFSYPIAAFLFGYRLTFSHPFLFALSLLLTMLALTSLGLVIAPFMAVNIGADIWGNVMEWPVYILGGFLFPVSLLPDWTTPISYVLPPYWAARALHATSSDSGSLDDIVVSWGLLVGFSVLYWFISARLFRVLLRRAREEATLGIR